MQYETCFFDNGYELNAPQCKSSFLVIKEERPLQEKPEEDMKVWEEEGARRTHF